MRKVNEYWSRKAILKDAYACSNLSRILDTSILEAKYEGCFCAYIDFLRKWLKCTV